MSGEGEERPGMELKEVLEQLESFAPLSASEPWDNTGLLLEPPESRSSWVRNLMLTNDLTESVLTEAIEKSVELIVSYHPPVFSPLKRITASSWKERIVARCLQNRIAVFSPHTSWDVIEGGINDWLLLPFNSHVASVDSLKRGENQKVGCTYTIQLPHRGELSEIDASVITQLMNYRPTGMLSYSMIEGKTQIQCAETHFPVILGIIMASPHYDHNLHITKSNKPWTSDRSGAGRIALLDGMLNMSDVIKMVKEHLGLKHVQVAYAVNKGKDSAIGSIAVCAGSGGSVLRGVRADVYVTGEMSHHEVLDAVHAGSHVILCGHSNTERGFLDGFATQFAILCRHRLGILVSKADADPLCII